MGRNQLSIFRVFDDIERGLFADIDRTIFSDLWTHNFPSFNAYIEGEDGKKELVFEYALAGYSKDEIDVKHENDHLIVKVLAKKKEDDGNKEWLIRNLTSKSFVRKDYVPSSRFDTDSSKASYDNGILKVSFPLRKEHQNKSISID